MVDLPNVSCCLITKETTYPHQILERLSKLPFGEILILTHSDSPHRKYELFQKAKFDWIYYQDDDAICPVIELAAEAEEGIITQAIKPGHFEWYKDKRVSVGLGWGAFFQKSCLKQLQRYIDVYGEDDVFKRETERILTYFNYPQKRLILPIEDLPSAMAPDRLSMQPGHYDYIHIVEERCQGL